MKAFLSRRTHLYRTIFGALISGTLLLAPSLAFAAEIDSISGLIIGAVGFLLWIAASMFDASITLFVLQMGELVTGTTGIGIGKSIDLVWAIVRDLVNLTFIFGLVYVGIKTILNAGTDTKKMLATIIISALLVNFSLFISKVVIDVSNIAAIEIYQQMGIAEEDRPPEYAAPSVASAFMAQMGIVQLVATPGGGSTALSTGRWLDTAGNLDGYLVFVIGASIFILVAALVFAAGAILLSIRFGLLILLMMLSPVAFAASVFPVFAGWSKKWWKTLLSQAFFAPAYLFMIYITLMVAEGYRDETASFAGIYSPTETMFSDGFESAAFFAITIVLMVASLVIAKQMGAYGANTALAFGEKAARFGAGRITSFAGRNTIGRASEWALKKSDNLEGTLGGRNAKRLLTLASLGTISERTRREAFTAGTKAKFGGSYSRADDKSFDKEMRKVRSSATRAQDRDRAIAAYQADPTDPNKIKAMQDEVQKMTLEEIADLKEDTLKDVVGYLSLKQMDQISDDKSGSLTGTQITELKEARKTHFTNTFNAAKTKVRTQIQNGEAPTAVRDFFKGMKNEEVAKLPTSVLLQRAAIASFTPGMLGSMINTLSTADRATIRGEIQPNPHHPAHEWLMRTSRGQEF